MCKTCSKLKIKIWERSQWRRSDVFLIKFEPILHIVLLFLLLTSNKYIPAGPRRNATFSTKSNTCPWVLFTFFKLHKWYHIGAKHLIQFTTTGILLPWNMRDWFPDTCWSKHSSRLTPEAHSESCQTFKMELSAEIFKGWKMNN